MPGIQQWILQWILRWQAGGILEVHSISNNSSCDTAINNKQSQRRTCFTVCAMFALLFWLIQTIYLLLSHPIVVKWNIQVCARILYEP